MKNYKLLIILPITALIIGILPYFLVSGFIYRITSYMNDLIPIAVYISLAYILNQFKQRPPLVYSCLLISILYLAIFILEKLIKSTVELTPAYLSSLKLIVISVWLYQLFAFFLIRDKTLRFWYFALTLLSLAISVLEFIPIYNEIYLNYIVAYRSLHILLNLLLIVLYLNIHKLQVKYSES